MPKVPILSIVAESGTGKTTLLEKVVKEMKRRGIRLAVIKHTHHFEIDQEGKDTSRFAEAGADIVAISSPDKFAFIERTKTELSIDDIASRMSDVDIIITEGYKKGDKPKIEVFRSQVSKKLICSPEELIAIVSDVPFDLGVPWYHLDDVSGLTDEIERFMNSFMQSNI